MLTRTGPKSNEQRQNEDSDLPNIQENDAEAVILLDTTENNNTLQNDETIAHSDDEQMDTEPIQRDEQQDPVQDDAYAVLQAHSSETLVVAATEKIAPLLVSGGMDDIAFVWDLQAQQIHTKIEGFNDSTSTISFSNDANYIAIGSENGTITILNTQDETFSNSRIQLEGPSDAVSFLSWHPKGPVLLAGSTDGMAYMWNAAKGTFMKAFVGHESAITCGSFTRDGKLVVTGSNDKSIRVWNPVTGQTMTRIQTGVSNVGGTFHSGEIQCMVVGNNESNLNPIIASGCSQGQVFLSHRETGQIIRQLPSHNDGVETISCSPSFLKPVFVASGGSDGHIKVWDIEKSVERCDFQHADVVVKIIWHPNRPLLISASSDGSIAIWNVMTVKQVALLKGHQGYITDICLAGGNELIASTSSDQTIRLFDIRPYVE